MSGGFKGTLSGDFGAEPLPPAEFRGTLSGDFGDGAPSPDAAPPASEEPATPHYGVGRELGRGGMGIVWLATQRTLDRPVALKTLRPEQATAPSEAKFEAEAIVTGRLEHPSIPPVHDYGRDDHGRPFLCMKLV